jgi:DNA-binding CsgD family transcriptional regulator
MTQHQSQGSGGSAADAVLAADHLAHRAFALVTDAASYIMVAGRQMLVIGRVSKAVSLLDRARVLLSVVDDLELRASTVEALIEAYVATGQVRAARNLSAEVDRLEGSGLGPQPLVSLRIQLAWADVLAGDPPSGLARVHDSKSLLDGRGRDHLSLELDAVEAALLAQTFRAELAGRLARDVIEAASERALPRTACRAWEVLGTVTRRADLAESTASFRQARLLALRHRLPSHRLRAQLELGLNEWVSTGDASRLALARREAERSHVLLVSSQAGALIAMNLTFLGLYPQARALLERYLVRVRDAGLDLALRWVLLARSVLAAHQRLRGDMETALTDLAAQSRGGPYLRPLALTVGTAVCALLEADTERAALDLRQALALDSECPGPLPVASWDSLDLLPGAGIDPAGRPERADRADRADRAERAGGGAEPETLPFWSRPFAQLSRAATLGRQGRPAEAMAAVTLAGRTSAPYPLLHHLGLRMIAEIAYDDGWGTPAAWLRQAEAFFHDFPAPAVSNACRSLLQRMGAPVPQHRQDTNRIPGSLRTLGVTVREYEVLHAIKMTGGRGNKEVAEVLCISPRTVEKHVASLLAKTGLASRKALADLMAEPVG